METATLVAIFISDLFVSFTGTSCIPLLGNLLNN